MASSLSRPVDTPSSRESRSRGHKRKSSYKSANGSSESEDDEEYRPRVSTVSGISILVFTLSTEKTTW